jgi:polyisoprenoid-binding protein YceI
MWMDVFLLVAGVMTAAGAEDPATPVGLAFRFDPERSQVEFTLGATLHTVHGTAALEEGRVRYDPATGAVTGRIVVDARSADTGNERRDRDMHEDVLESETYGQIVFVPESVRGDWSGTGEGALTLVGTMSIHGSEHPLKVPVEVALEDGTLIVDGEFEVPYVEWGMEDPSFFVLRVKEFVTVSLHLVGTRVPGP